MSSASYNTILSVYSAAKLKVSEVKIKIEELEKRRAVVNKQLEAYDMTVQYPEDLKKELRALRIKERNLQTSITKLNEHWRILCNQSFY